MRTINYKNTVAYLNQMVLAQAADYTDNTVQDEPTWTISTIRGVPTSEKTEFDRGKRAHHEYHIFVTI